MKSPFLHRKKTPRVLVLGLDCASPDLVFNQFKSDLPTFTRLRATGTWDELTSCIPCITIPACSSMTSSSDPGVLGCYGFRDRADHSYDRMNTANSTAIGEKRVWDYQSGAGRQSVVIGVPQTYPLGPITGHMIG